MPVHICGPHLSVPSKEHGECLEAVWSVGKACRRCDHPTCYRKGWLKAAVDADNRKLCATPTKQEIRDGRTLADAMADPERRRVRNGVTEYKLPASVVRRLGMKGTKE